MTHKHHIVAMILDKRGKVLSIGQNSYVDSIRLQRKHANKVGLPEKKFTHGEVQAIAKCRDLSKAHTIKVARYTKDGKPANAKPCLVCMSAIAESGIKNIEYTVGEE
jgi:tRNA(Arg) A34 adenosine deaminase TadA